MSIRHISTAVNVLVYYSNYFKYVEAVPRKAAKRTSRQSKHAVRKSLTCIFRFGGEGERQLRKFKMENWILVQFMTHALPPGVEGHTKKLYTLSPVRSITENSYQKRSRKIVTVLWYFSDHVGLMVGWLFTVLRPAQEFFT